LIPCAFEFIFLGLVDGKKVCMSADPLVPFLPKKRREHRKGSNSLPSLLMSFDPSAQPVDRALLP